MTPRIVAQTILAELILMTGPIDYYERNVSTIEKALIEYGQKEREKALEEAANRLMMDCSCAAQSSHVCEHRFEAAKILSLLEKK